MARIRHQKTKLKRNIINKVATLQTAQVAETAHIAALMKLPKKQRGLYPQWQVARIDGSSAIGKKHNKCFKFVLDLHHDAHAAPALFSYAMSARADGYEQLALDIMTTIQPYIKALNDKAEADAGADTATDALGIDIDAARLTDSELIAQVNNIWLDLPATSNTSKALEELLKRFEVTKHTESGENDAEDNTHTT